MLQPHSNTVGLLDDGNPVQTRLLLLKKKLDAVVEALEQSAKQFGTQNTSSLDALVRVVVTIVWGPAFRCGLREAG